MRNGVNQPIQGTSADILKRALKLLHDSNRGTSARLVNIVHDEILLECDASEAEDTARRLEAKMIQAGEEYVKTIPIEVDAVVANEWRKK
jgi:DNA polymerase-1